MCDNEKRKIKLKTPLPPLSERPSTECGILQGLREEKAAELHDKSGGLRGPIPNTTIKCTRLLTSILPGREKH